MDNKKSHEGLKCAIAGAGLITAFGVVSAYVLPPAISAGHDALSRVCAEVSSHMAPNPGR